mmetsp:Transcript_4188/g.5400  ORF Transcript_4188/g.5400 Transcript_4188/m.5400 type:complete len:254 (+) Transcript_4188:1-762(+)
MVLAELQEENLSESLEQQETGKLEEGDAKHLKGRQTSGGDTQGVGGSGVTAEELLRRLDRLERSYKETNAEYVDFDDMAENSLLEMFGQTVKYFLTTRVVKPTDEECKFNYEHARCEPKCECSFNYKFGDYTLTRSCRAMTPYEKAYCDPNAYHPSDDTLIQRTERFTSNVLQNVGDFISDKVAPPTDKECYFNRATFKCEPRDLCHFHYQFGDYHFGRSCRIKQEENIEEEESIMEEEEEEEIIITDIETEL